MYRSSLCVYLVMDWELSMHRNGPPSRSVAGGFLVQSHLAWQAVWPVAKLEGEGFVGLLCSNEVSQIHFVLGFDRTHSASSSLRLVGHCGDGLECFVALQFGQRWEGGVCLFVAYPILSYGLVVDSLAMAGRLVRGREEEHESSICP